MNRTEPYAVEQISTIPSCKLWGFVCPYCADACPGSVSYRSRCHRWQSKCQATGTPSDRNTRETVLVRYLQIRYCQPNEAAVSSGSTKAHLLHGFRRPHAIHRLLEKAPEVLVLRERPRNKPYIPLERRGRLAVSQTYSLQPWREEPARRPVHDPQHAVRRQHHVAQIQVTVREDQRPFLPHDWVRARVLGVARPLIRGRPTIPGVGNPSKMRHMLAPRAKFLRILKRPEEPVVEERMFLDHPVNDRSGPRSFQRTQLSNITTKRASDAEFHPPR